ncbi:MAG: YqaE/Pmp3 family membrane protein [Bacteroidia bacterium]|nr:YqaE/Pmp3 family membrane protein [Bacteroidia bacterium]
MKNLLLLFSVAAIFASSCSSKIGIAKRKYGKGYYVSVSHKPKAVTKESPEQISKPSPETVAQVRVNGKEDVKSVQVPKPVVADVENTKVNLNASNKDSKALTLQASAAKKNNLKNNAVIKALNAAALNKGAASKKADDTNTILLVILCLFWWLNLIAVYLHQGKKITNDFWITLILDITFILGVVYAILVVLDVLSFA